MIRGVIKNGVIEPLEPLPAGWDEGRQVSIEDAEDTLPNAERIQRWHEALEAMCASSDSEDEQLFHQAIEQARTQAKVMVRREMGLP